MDYLNLGALSRAPLAHEPFDHVVVPDFVPLSWARQAMEDFPAIPHSGLLPLSEITGGPAFLELAAEIQSLALTEAMAEKFGVALDADALIITVRANCAVRDGSIHTDSASKLVTALLYLNEAWQVGEGQLRLLRKPDDLEDFAAEVPPLAGTLVAFRRGERSFHGHKPYSGPRRYLMVNWMVDAGAARRELFRHRLSAKAKRMTALMRGVA